MGLKSGADITVLLCMYIDNTYYLNKVRGYLFKICGVIIVSGCLHSWTCTHNIEMGRPWCYPMDI